MSTNTLRSKYISLSVCLCDPHVLSASDSELECSCSSHGGRCWVAMRGKRQSRRNFLRQKEVWQMHKHTLTHTQREGGREEGKEQELLVISSPAPPPPRRLRAGGVYLAVFGLSGRGSVIVQQHPAVLFGWVSVSGAGSFPRLCAASVWSPASRFQRIAPSCHSQLVPSSVQTPSPSLLTYEI